MGPDALHDFNDWGVGFSGGFLHILESNSPTTEGGDGVKWKLKKKMGTLIYILLIMC